MFTTIAICTFNRCDLLDKTLSQLSRLDVDNCGDWEIIVVNNNCTDDTDTVIRRHSCVLPVRRLAEPRPGKSYAANLAVREAKGELILWIDDDVLVDRLWLNGYVQAANAHPDVSFFGGPVFPWFEIEPPAWLSRHLAKISYCFAAQAPFDEPFTPITPPRFPFGANMGMRRDCFRECRFDSNLGPVGRTNYQDEEVVLLETLFQRGRKGLWVREAQVQHFIPAARLTERYVWQYHTCYGRTRVRRSEVTLGKQLFGVSRWIVRKYLQSLAVCTLWSPTKNDRWLREFQNAAICRGMISEFREQSRSRREEGRRPLQRDGALTCK
jgi:glucosyl-dolichyl phosphate glucuronosyltransferase